MRRDRSGLLAQSRSRTSLRPCAKAPRRPNWSLAARDRSRSRLGGGRRRTAMELRVRELSGCPRWARTESHAIECRGQQRWRALAAPQLFARRRRADRSVFTAAAARAARHADCRHALHRCKRGSSRRLGIAASTRPEQDSSSGRARSFVRSHLRNRRLLRLRSHPIAGSRRRSASGAKTPEHDDPVGDGLEVRAFAVPGTTPGFDGRRSVKGAVVAYRNLRAVEHGEFALRAGLQRPRRDARRSGRIR